MVKYPQYIECLKSCKWRTPFWMRGVASEERLVDEWEFYVFLG